MAIESTPTIYTIRDFLNWQRDGTLELRPPFQRLAVWKPIAKSSLIDSLLRGYPVPALFLQDRTDPKSFHRRLVVVDGQQRLRTVLAFVDIPSLRDADDRDHFTIMAIHDAARAGKGFQDLSDTDRDRILSTRFNVNIVGSSVPETELLEIFRRMNTYGARLNAQELRNANFQGYFKEVAYRTAAEALDYWLRWGLFNRQQIAEMSDVEFTSDLMMLVIRGVDAGTKKALDDAYEKYDDEFEEREVCLRRFSSIMNVLDEVYADRQTPRLVSKMWTYSLFDALQRIMYGGPISATNDQEPTRVALTRIKNACLKVHSQIVTENLPLTVDRATRGGATDRASRNARAAHLAKLINRS
jgi:hypothetical protein